MQSFLFKDGTELLKEAQIKRFDLEERASQLEGQAIVILVLLLGGGGAYYGRGAGWGGAHYGGGLLGLVLIILLILWLTGNLGSRVVP
jgi:Protein of unknown function (DUF3309)